MIGFFVLFAVAAIFILLLLFLRLTSLNERVSWLERKLDDLMHERTQQQPVPPPSPQPVRPHSAAPPAAASPQERAPMPLPPIA